MDLGQSLALRPVDRTGDLKQSGAAKPIAAIIPACFHAGCVRYGFPAALSLSIPTSYFRVGDRWLSLPRLHRELPMRTRLPQWKHVPQLQGPCTMDRRTPACGECRY